MTTKSPELTGSRSTLGKKKKDPGIGNESFLDKLSTLGRGGSSGKKEQEEEAEARRVELEGQDAIDTPGSPIPKEIKPEDLELKEGEERRLISPQSRNSNQIRHIVKLLIDWINDELAPQRIVVKDIEEDLYDGQIIQKLMEKLTGVRIEVPEVSQSEEGQQKKLEIVLQYVENVLRQGQQPQQIELPESRWTVHSIHNKDMISILHLCIALAIHFRAPVRFPENARATVMRVNKRDGKLYTREYLEQLTTTQEELGLRGDRDAFDTLLDHAPEKLFTVKKSLITFVNKHLNKINLEVTDLDTQFSDGVYLVLLMGLLDGYFVPLFSFHLTPSTFEQKVHNVQFAFELIQEAKMSKPKTRPEDIVNMDLKCTLRVLYSLFSKYKYYE